MRDELSKIKLNFRISSRVFEKMRALVDNGEYEDISDVVVSAIHQMLERSEKKDHIEAFVIQYLKSDTGRAIIREILWEERLLPNSSGVISEIPKVISEKDQPYTVNNEKQKSSDEDQ
ncbi:MAG: hypothetical protein Q8N94_02290 [Methanoregula sp.]|nr:hypothetical protein [Methanoregula sp.]